MKRKGAASEEEGKTKRLTTYNDSLDFLLDVRKTFHNEREKYDELREIIRDFSAKRMNYEEVTTRVKELFKGHQHLISGFKAFLPKGYETPFLNEQIRQYRAKKPMELEGACQFVQKVKLRLGGEGDPAYKSFLDILSLYGKGTRNLNEVHREVTALLQDHEDLLKEFTHFLPPEESSDYAEPSSSSVEASNCSRIESGGSHNNPGVEEDKSSSLEASSNAKKD